MYDNLFFRFIGNMNKKITKIFEEPLLLIALPFSIISLLLIFIIRPFIRIRIALLFSDRIGHFAGNTELYLCDQEINQPRYKHIDLHYFPRKRCNNQLARMWKRELNIMPWFFLRPLDLIIRSFSVLSSFHALAPSGGDRDIDNLMERSDPHLRFTSEEEKLGKAGLISMGIADGSKFVCLNVRDNAYLPGPEYSYHDFRNSDIQNYILASEELTKRGYFVIRMGVIVNEAINSLDPMVIDYATNGMRSDFMDIYLGAKCNFCISVGSGFDAVTNIFRRPIVEVNFAPIGNFYTWGNTPPILLAKHYVDVKSGLKLSLNEIFSRNVGFCYTASDFELEGVRLVENTPEEIRDAVMEMACRLEGKWVTHDKDNDLQIVFWDNFPVNAVGPNGVRWHGKINSYYSANFLRNNNLWLSE